MIGLPPLAGFIGKFALLAAVPDEWVGWVWTTVLVSSFLVLVAMARAGNKLFWHTLPEGQDDPVRSARRRRGHWTEHAAVIVLLGYSVALTIAAAPAMRYAMAAGEQLGQPDRYIQSVRAVEPLLREK